MINILLADDHEIFRQALSLLLSSQPDFKVVGLAVDGGQALNLVEALRPDVAVLDLLMPGMSGVEITHQVSKRFPGTRVVILSMYADESYVVSALQNGASGYVLKESSTADLVRAVRSAAAGQRFLSPSLAERAINAYIESRGSASAVRSELDLLTAREREVLQLSVHGLTAAAIAERLSISVRTAETHRNHLMHKLGVHNQEELAAYLRKQP